MCVIAYSALDDFNFELIFLGRKSVLELLLKNGADRTISNKSGQTPLAVAEEMYDEFGLDDYQQMAELLKATWKLQFLRK